MFLFDGDVFDEAMNEIEGRDLAEADVVKQNYPDVASIDLLRNGT